MSVKGVDRSKKYQDAPRFPKITNGYEGEATSMYQDMSVNLVKMLGLKMKQFVESQNHHRYFK